ncbi:MAG: hypothetical protein VKL59_11710 [Nostocaceae cyanobacterium]|nr:hypothetical protein [Nostocaceae cyanobacterium]
MKFDGRFLNSVVFTCGLFAVNTILSAPAKAQVSCEPGSVAQHSNGSVANCRLSSNVTVQASHSNGGSFTFSCKGGYYIYFDDQGQFESCVLSAPVEMRNDNASQICPAEHRVSISEKGNPPVSCQIR